MLTPAALSPALLRSPPSRGTANTTAATASAHRSKTSPKDSWTPSPPQPTSTPRSSVGRILGDWVTSSMPHLLTLSDTARFFDPPFQGRRSYVYHSAPLRSWPSLHLDRCFGILRPHFL
ncbi:unnamed protein product [Ectocarpus sp. 6 AP-2014]